MIGEALRNPPNIRLALKFQATLMYILPHPHLGSRMMRVFCGEKTNEKRGGYKPPNLVKVLILTYFFVA